MKSTVDAGAEQLVIVSPDAGIYTRERALPVSVTVAHSLTQTTSVKYDLALVDGGAHQSGFLRNRRGNGFSDTLRVNEQGAYRLTFTAGQAQASASLTVDWEAPVASLFIYPPPGRVDDGGFSEVDPTPGFKDAFRKDEKATVRISCSESVDDCIVTWTNGLPNNPSRVSCPDSCDAGSCACWQIDLATEPMNAWLRESVNLGVLANDRAGNRSAYSEALLKVTRWKWRRTVAPGADVSWQLGLDSRGRLFVPAPTGQYGGDLVGLNSDGAEIFRSDTLGYPFHLMVASDAVYLASASQLGSGFRKFDFNTGIRIRSACEQQQLNFDSPLFLAEDGTARARFVTHACSKTFDCGPVLIEAGPAFGATCIRYTDPEGGLRGVFADEDKVYVLLDVKYRPFTWQLGEWVPLTDVPHVFYPSSFVFLSKPNSVGAMFGIGFRQHVGGAYVAQGDGGSVFKEVADAGRDLRLAAIGGDYSLPYILGCGRSMMVKVAYSREEVPALSIVDREDLPEAYGSAPIIGADHTIYVSTLSGMLRAYIGGSLKTVYSDQAFPSGTELSFNIDVSRQPNGSKDCSKPGVLYALERRGGNLYAFIVDSKGIDAEAPWPKYQHDPRNTGNSKTSLKDFSCP